MVQLFMTEAYLDSKLPATMADTPAAAIAPVVAPRSGTTSATASAALQKLRIGIVGGTGYTGVELLRILARHPQATIATITSRKEAGTPVAQMFPSLRRVCDLAFSDPASADLAHCDVVFFAKPHGVAMSQAREDPQQL